VRSPNPIPSPFPIKNIRGVERWEPGYVVTGSEDGDICLVKVVEGSAAARMRYNATAQRGVNDIDTCGDYLVPANCSVGPDDKNLRLYRIHGDGSQGAHRTPCPRIVSLLRERGMSDCLIGGGIISQEDIPLLKEQGIAEVFLPAPRLKRWLNSCAKMSPTHVRGRSPSLSSQRRRGPAGS
jgi:hypothetical protein